MPRPRGTRDFAPDEQTRRRVAEHRLRGVFERFAYREVQTPTFEELDLFLAKSGEGVLGELYDFEDKGGRKMCLRPELTAPVMRMVFEDHAFDAKPLKWFYHGACYRYDRPQAGRYREFWQFGCEQVGAGTPLAYAELVALGAACFDELGLKTRETRIGHVKVLGALVDALGLDADTRGKAMRLIDKRDDDGLRALCTGAGVAAGVLDGLLTALDASDAASARAAVAACLGNVPDDVAAMLDEWEQVLDLVAAFGVEAQPDLGIARGLDYYTGVVFEVHCPLLGAQKQLLGGGGYDLSGVFGAQPIPSMGFGLGFDRLLVALEAEGVEIPISGGPDVAFGALSERARLHVIRIAKELREAGVSVDVDLLGRKPGQVAKHADGLGAKRLVLIGDRDLDNGAVRVKDLASGDQVDVQLDALVAHLSA